VRIVVTGGLGDLGARVVRSLADRGHEVLAASRRTGVDLRTGAGLAAAVEGVDAVVHCVTDPLRASAVDADGTRRLAQALASQPRPPHLVAVSIVGCDANPLPFYRVKAVAEVAIASAGGPATIVRATQFHALVAFAARTLRLGRVGLTVGELSFQPVDVRWVAERLADRAAGPAPDGCLRAPDLAGPERLSLERLSRLVAAHEGRAAPHSLTLPAVGPALRALSEGSNLPAGPVETGGRTFGEWLAAQPARLPRSIHDRT
jgi:uncharacterized protein YbjT (DUF2867 family)